VEDVDTLDALLVWAATAPRVELADLPRAFVHQLVRGGITTMTDDQTANVAADPDAYQHLRVERRGPTAFVTLARPDVRNAFNARLIAELHAVFTRLAAEEDLRAIVLRGEGRTFCAGADLTWMRDSLDFTHEENVADARRMAAMFQAIDDCPCPVIGRIQGAALGGGAGLAAVCDLVIAADDTRFGFTEARLGIAPAVIAPVAVRKIGESHARALFTTAERFDAAHALRIGLVHRVVPAADLDAAVDKTLAEIGKNGPAAVRAAKRMARQVGHLAPDEALRLTTETIAGLRVSPEGQEGIRAFLEKRTASWVTDDV
jgi:methylglutaconyl-CoA hydratase